MPPRLLLALTMLQVNPTTAGTGNPEPHFEAEPALKTAIGEIFRRDLRIHAPPEFELVPSSLPVPARMEGGLELRKVEWSSQIGNGEALFQIHLSYQIFRGLRSPERIQLPELLLRFSLRGETREIPTPIGEVTLTPLIPAELPDERVQIRPPDAPSAESTSTARLALASGTGLLVLVLLYGAWLLALFPFQVRRRRPFARAWRDLRKPLRRGEHEAAFRIIHRALDQTAGYPMFADRVEGLLETRPAFVPLRNHLHDFFAASRQVFYAPANRPGRIGTTDFSDVASQLRELCRLGMELERQ